MIEEATAVERKQRENASLELGACSFLYRAVVRHLQTRTNTMFKFYTTYDENTNLFDQGIRGFDPNYDAMKPLAAGMLSSSSRARLRRKELVLPINRTADAATEVTRATRLRAARHAPSLWRLHGSQRPVVLRRSDGACLQDGAGRPRSEDHGCGWRVQSHVMAASFTPSSRSRGRGAPPRFRTRTQHHAREIVRLVLERTRFDTRSCTTFTAVNWTSCS